MVDLIKLEKSPITKTALLSIAGILISAGVIAIDTDLKKGAILIILGILILAVREYFKTIPEVNTEDKKQ